MAVFRFGIVDILGQRFPSLLPVRHLGEGFCHTSSPTFNSKIRRVPDPPSLIKECLKSYQISPPEDVSMSHDNLDGIVIKGLDQTIRPPSWKLTDHTFVGPWHSFHNGG